MFEKRETYKLTLNSKANKQMNGIAFFFNINVSQLFKSAMGFCEAYMNFKKKYPDAKIYFNSEKDEVKQEVMMFKDDE